MTAKKLKRCISTKTKRLQEEEVDNNFNKMLKTRKLMKMREESGR